MICKLCNFFPFSKNVDYLKQFLNFLSLLQKHGLSYAIFGISFPSQKTWTIICNFWNFFPKTWTMICNLWNFFPFSKNTDYHKQFRKFLSLFQKRGLPYAVFLISFRSQKTWTIICNFFNFFPKTWTTICNFWNFYPFSKNVDYHKQFLKFLSLLQKRGLLYAIFGISFPSQRTWTIICIFLNFFPFSKNVDYHMQFLEFLSKNVDYHMQFREFLSLLKKRGPS